MRHFGYLTAGQDESLFARAPQPFDRDSERGTLAMALGATLYSPGTTRDYARRIGALVGRGVTSAVLCLEDAIRDTDVPAAERNVAAQLAELHETHLRQACPAAPLLFVRVRHPDQVRSLIKEAGEAAAILTGFVFPKFTASAGSEFLGVLAEMRAETGLPLYGMPVLESAQTTYAETRVAELLAVRDLVAAHAEAVLAVRIGATDMCGLFGLRRSNDQTVYDLTLVREVIADIVNVFCRDAQFVVSGPVWEYFARGERMFKPMLRESPFRARGDLPNAVRVRRQLVRSDLDGLLREVVLDKATGIIGKTVIHPSHVLPVHAMLVVTAEEHSDALATLCLTDGGVRSSEYANKMLESKPHARWATGILRRAAVFGVLRPDRTFVDLLDIEDVGA
ncbi:MAG TPA: HpcH/HpaI aldolase/citrate lyase family protein [Streptosporangiaceae bacterium]|nr:HpcH/HpaI aldolase/citrate lyase family protein [Streptosporangiaceae bacterium]